MDFFDFPNSSDRVNAFNKSLSIQIPIGKSYPVGADFTTQMNLYYGSNVWDWSQSNGVISAKPQSRFFNAGLGFQLGFGRLIEPGDNPYGLWMYVSPQGKLYRLYDNFSGEPPVPDVYYSHDETKLRLRKHNSVTMKLEFTNGEVHLFRQQEGSWEIYKRLDQFGNYQQFSYRLDLNRVTTSDNHGRTQWIHFKADPSGFFPRVIDKVRVTRIGSVAAYFFNYSTLTISTPTEDNDPSTSVSVTIPILDNISYPLSEKSAFTYHGNSNVGAGRIHQYTNNFGGKVEYTYSEFDMPYGQNPSNLSQSVDHFASDVIGISERKAIDVGGVLLGAWNFSHSWHAGTRSSPPSLDQPTGMVSIMVQPDGFTHKRYFRTPIQDIVVTSPQAHTSTKSEYGFRGLVNDWVNAYESAIKSNVQHEYFRAATRFSCANCLDPVIKVTLNLRHPKNGFITRKSFSGHNWQGNPSETKLMNNWTVVSTTNVERDEVVPGVGDLWLATKPHRKTITEGLQSKITEQCTNELGEIIRKRSLRGSVQAANDFIQEFVSDASGNNIESRLYGGDDHVVPSGDLCQISLGPAPFSKFKEFSFGTVSRRGYLNSDGSVFHETYNATVHQTTGLVLTKSSGDGLFDSYIYDKLNRVVSIAKPQGHGATFTNIYTPASGSTKSKVNFKMKSQDGASLVVNQIVESNGFGKTVNVHSEGPGGWASSFKTYDAMNRLASSTSADGGVTLYLNRDYKGRVGIQRPPEGSNHDISNSYVGDKQVTRIFTIAKDMSLIPPIETIRAITTNKDIYGRNTSQTVTDEDGAARNRATTYDNNGHWVTKTEGNTTLTNQEQFDAFGRLTRNSFGSSITYNALGQKLESYSRYGDKIDYVYDQAGRRIYEYHNGVLYGSYVYAVANSPGQFNKGKLIYARRINRNVPDVAGKIINVYDHYEYGGLNGRADKRKTELADNLGAVFVSYESSAEYNDLGQIETFYSPACTETATFDCSGQAQSSKVYSASYDLGRLVSASEGGAYLISNIQYDFQGRPTSYQLGNGLITNLGYQQGVEQPYEVVVNDDAVQIWSSGLANVDGRGQVTNYGTNQTLPDNFYDTTTLRAQPTAYEYTPRNSSYMPDPYGQMIDQATNSCEGAYPPCKNISVYNFKNEIVWFRQRPNAWPISPIGLKTPSRLYVFDLFHRPGGFIYGNSAYFNDKANYSISLTANYSGYLYDEQMYGDGFTIGINDNEFQTGTFYHSDLKSRDFGSSDIGGTFSPSQ